MKRIQLWYNKNAPKPGQMHLFEGADAVLVGCPTLLATWLKQLRRGNCKILPYISFYKSPRLTEIPELATWEAGSPCKSECVRNPFWKAVASDEHPEWLAWDEAGRIRRPFGSDDYARGWNETSPLVESYRQACLTGVRAMLAEGYDGVFLDNVIIGGRPAHAGLGSAKDVAAAMRSLVLEAGQLVRRARKVFMINGELDRRFRKVVDVFSLESFMFSWAWDASLFESDQWKRLWREYRVAGGGASGGPQPAAISYLGFSGRSPREDAFALLASAWILGMAVCDAGTVADPASIAAFAAKNLFQGATSTAMRYQAHPVRDAWVRTFYTLDLGKPRGPAHSRDGCLVRHFERGTCIFNPMTKPARVRLKTNAPSAHELACDIDVKAQGNWLTVYLPSCCGRIIMPPG